MPSTRNHDDDKLARLSAYLDGTLDPAARSVLEKELEQDHTLRAELAAFRKLDELVRQCRPKAPELDWDRFVRQARRRREAHDASRGRKVTLRLSRPLAAAAALALAVTASFIARYALTSREGAGGEAIAIVSVERSGFLNPPGAGVALADVKISRGLPADAVATVGPAPRGRTLLVVAGEAADRAWTAEEEERESFF